MTYCLHPIDYPELLFAPPYLKKLKSKKFGSPIPWSCLHLPSGTKCLKHRVQLIHCQCLKGYFSSSVWLIRWNFYLRNCFLIRVSPVPFMSGYSPYFQLELIEDFDRTRSCVLMDMIDYRFFLTIFLFYLKVYFEFWLNVFLIPLDFLT
jgi:hypothetical protein